ncbi:VWA domain-containing protein [Colwellia sp. 75C3]|uniref:vWA domain-containing protein n=1 Tax=Colwellia sp. 75C3 TaxID=888425 RepID=UPI000C32CC7D|nr:VWA domain-containing protein [Colwellia sp. 75C3]PKG84215.1 VWA domain-containing protein [Colwellia sp. 75C3]
MKKLFSISLISTALLLTGCAQEKDLAASNESINAKQEVVIAEQKQLADRTRKQMMVDKKAVKLTREKLMSAQMSYVSLSEKKYRSVGQVGQMPPAHFINEANNNEKYSHQKSNGTLLVAEQPVSTFSIDVDTAAYANVRRLLNQGKLPQHDAVRVEELVNYFSYDYPTPTKQPFSVYSEVAPSPYNADKYLLHLGIKGKAVPKTERPAANLVFLLDVSGSMNNANKMGLLKNALKMLTNQLNQDDSVAIVVYAGAAGVVLKPTKGDNKPAIIDALSQLSAGGSTNGGAGIEAAYRLAQQSFIKGGINRIMLATDGDFNVGTVNNQALKNLIENKRKSGIDLSVLGFGSGNYNDELMQQLAQTGNGNAYYIDNLHEARKVLVEELSSTLFTIAKDVKIQVEFNPSIVSEYRLIGYETRALKREDFNNDNVDAGEIGAGHTVTAIYEISLVNGKNKANDTLRYQAQNTAHQTTTKNQNEFAFLRLRYKNPTENSSQLIEVPLLKSDIIESITATSNSYKFSAAVAGFAQLLRGGENLSTMNKKDIIDLAQQGRGEDRHGYRGEFINMVKLAQALSPQLSASNGANNAVDHE